MKSQLRYDKDKGGAATVTPITTITRQELIRRIGRKFILENKRCDAISNGDVSRGIKGNPLLAAQMRELAYTTRMSELQFLKDQETGTTIRNVSLLPVGCGGREVSTEEATLSS